MTWPNAPAPKVTLGLLRRIFSFLKPYTRLLVASFAVIVASAGLGVAPSLLTGAILENLRYAKPAATRNYPKNQQKSTLSGAFSL